MNGSTCIRTYHTHTHLLSVSPFHSYCHHPLLHTTCTHTHTSSQHLKYRIDFCQLPTPISPCMQAYYKNRVHSMEKHEAKCQLLKHMCQPSTTTAYFPVKVGHTYVCTQLPLLGCAISNIKECYRRMLSLVPRLPQWGEPWKPKQHLCIIRQCDGWVDQSLLASVSYIVYHISADLCHIVYHISADLCHISVEMAQVSTNMVHQRMPYIGYTSQPCLRSTHTSCYNYTYRVVCTLQQHNSYDYVLHVRNRYIVGSEQTTNMHYQIMPLTPYSYAFTCLV